MNERIRELAEQAGDLLVDTALSDWHIPNEFVEKFAELVRADEREACAMEADYEAARWPYAPECRGPCEEIAKAIRARGER